MKTKEQIEKALRVCCGEDNYRLILHNPFIIQSCPEKVFASDANVLLAVSRMDGQFPEWDCEGFPNIYPKPHNTSIIIEVSELRRAIDAAKKEPVYKTELKVEKCKECGGHGIVEWEYHGRHESYEKDDNCPVCEGNGECEQEVKIDETDHYLFIINQFIIIGNSRFHPLVIEKLVQVCEILKETECTVVHQTEPNKHTMVKIDECEMIIMPSLFDESNENVILSDKYRI